MSRFSCFLVISVLLMNFSLYSQDGATWTSIGPEGGMVQKIIAPSSNKSIVYASVSNSSLYKSENAGATWKLLKWFPSGINAFDVAPSDPDVVYVVSDSLYISKNGGGDWQKAGVPGKSFYYLTVDPTESKTIYVSAFNTTPGIWKSEDSGNSWTFVPFTGNVIMIAVDPASNNVVYAFSGQAQMYRSIDYGKKFELLSQVLTGGSLYRLLIDPTNNKRLYVSSSEGVFKSIDGGLSWKEKNSGEIDKDHPLTEDIILDPLHPNRLYRSVNNNWITFMSTDFGESWKKTSLKAGSLTIAADTILLSATRDGIYASNPDGENVRQSNKGVSSTTIRSIAVSSENDYKVFALTEDQGLAKASLYTFQEGSTEWQKSFWGRGASEIAVSPFNPEFAVGGFNLGSDRVNFTSNRGASWYSTALNDNMLSVAFSSYDSSVIFAGAFNGFYKSSDYGRNWAKINFPEIYSRYYHDVLHISTAKHDSTMFIILESGDDWYLKRTLLSSTDMGATWIDHHIQPLSVLILPSEPEVVLCGTYTPFKLLRSTNSGTNWTEIKIADGRIIVFSLESHKDIIYAGTDHGVYFSKDKGLTWAKLGVGPGVDKITCLAFSSSSGKDAIFAGTTAGGVYMLQLGHTDNDVNGIAEAGKISGFRLSNNYPNPFNSTTTIDYDIPASSRVVMEVFDMLGRRLNVLVDEVKPAGSYKQKIELNSFASGTYLIKITLGNNHESRKIILMK